MRKLISCVVLAIAAFCLTAYGQEFEVASIKSAPPQNMFHAPDSGSGGPGTSDPGTFRCASCTLGSLIVKAFALERYEFPGMQSLPEDAFAISAKIPVGTTPEQFQAMLQNLLKDRFALNYHLDKKYVQGYHLTVAKNGAKLTPAKEPYAAAPPAERGHGAWGGNGNGPMRPGLSFFMGGVQYRGDHQTMDELTKILANQLTKPVDDQTGLTGKYDIQLKWAGENAHAHPAGLAGGFDHNHGGNNTAAADPASGPTIFEALQSQLGLRLATAPKTTARLFVVDHVERDPTAN